MRFAALADVLKVILYVIASYVLAAAITPYLFEVGKGFANVALAKDTVDRVTWLAEKANKADFNSYFQRALLISAIFCLVPLFYLLDLRRHPRKSRSNPWTVGLPPRAIPSEMGQPLKKVRWGALQALTGFLITCVFFLLMTWFLFLLNWFNWKADPPFEGVGTLLQGSLLSALLFAVVAEFFFRGAMLGIFLRAFRPGLSIILLSLIFASAYFLLPPDDSVVSNPRSSMAGFELLNQIFERARDPDLLIRQFLPLFLVGVLLGMARYGTASLWLPIGLHTGWIFSSQMFSGLTVRRIDFPGSFEIYMGRELTEGLVPVGIILMTGIIIAAYLHLIRARPTQDFEE